MAQKTEIIRQPSNGTLQADAVQLLSRKPLQLTNVSHIQLTYSKGLSPDCIGKGLCCTTWFMLSRWPECYMLFRLGGVCRATRKEPPSVGNAVYDSSAWYLPEDSPSFEHLCHTADSRLFSAVLGNPRHVLHGVPPKSRSLLPAPDRDYMTVLFHKRTISHVDRL